MDDTEQHVPIDEAWNLIKPKQKKFIDGYLKTGTIKGGEENAGWGHGMGWKHLQKPVVRAAFIARGRAMDKYLQIDTAQTLREIKEIAFADMGEQKPTHDHKLRALEMLGRSQKLFTDKMEITGNLTLSMLVKATIAQRDKPMDLPAEYAKVVPALPAPDK